MTKLYGIALDHNGKVFITGITYSNEATSIGFPVIGGSYDTHYSGSGDAFVSKT